MAADRPPTTILRPGPRLTAAWVLSSVVLAVMVLQRPSAWWSGLYPEETWAVAALRGNDLVTLVLVAPALAPAMVASRRRPPARRCWSGSGCCSTALTTSLLRLRHGLHTSSSSTSRPSPRRPAAWCSSGRASTRTGRPRRRRGHPGPGRRRVHDLRRAGPARGVGRISVRFAVTGDLPENVMPPSAVHLVYALDMGVLAPAFLLAGVMLWRRMPWGAVLAVAVNASGAAYLAVLWAVGGFQSDAGSPVRRGCRLSRSARRSPASSATLTLLVRHAPRTRPRAARPATAPAHVCAG